jgi:hypothetical protein
VYFSSCELFISKLFPSRYVFLSCSYHLSWLFVLVIRHFLSLLVSFSWFPHVGSFCFRNLISYMIGQHNIFLLQGTSCDPNFIIHHFCRPVLIFVGRFNFFYLIFLMVYLYFENSLLQGTSFVPFFDTVCMFFFIFHLRWCFSFLFIPTSFHHHTFCVFAVLSNQLLTRIFFDTNVYPSVDIFCNVRSIKSTSQG